MRKSPTTAERREPRTQLAPGPHRTSPHDPELPGAWSRQRNNVCHWLSQAVRQRISPTSRSSSPCPTPTPSNWPIGEEALRYRTLARLGSKGFHYSLVTAVRVGGVIATVQTGDVLGPLPPDKLAEFKPEPSTDESVIATLIENVIDAEST